MDGYRAQDCHHANLRIYRVLVLSLKLVQELPRTFTLSEEKQVSVSEACACKPWFVKISRSANNLRVAPGRGWSCSLHTGVSGGHRFSKTPRMFPSANTREHNKYGGEPRQD